MIDLAIEKQNINNIDLLNNHPNMIVIVDLDSGLYLDSNKRTQEIYKKSNEQLKKMTIYDTAVPSSHKEIELVMKYAKKYGKVLPFRKHELRNIDKKSTSIDFNIEGLVLEDVLLLWQVNENNLTSSKNDLKSHQR